MNVLQVTDAKDRTLESRALASARDAARCGIFAARCARS